MDAHPSMLRVAIVEDEQDVALLIQHALERTGDFEVVIAATGDAAIGLVHDAAPDLVLLDLNLPLLSGNEVLRILRSRPVTAAIPVIVLTARGAESDRVKAFELGADDYVTKPFSLRELVARVRAVLRRGGLQPGSAPAPAGSYRGLHLAADFDAVAVQVDGEPVTLTRREFDLLRHLVANPDRVLSRERLLERVWGHRHDIDARSVDAHIGRLRSKLGPAGRQIETVVGHGYRFVEPGPAGDASPEAPAI